MSSDQATYPADVGPFDQNRATPDVGRAIACYREHAAGYDASARRTMPIRVRTIGRLGLQPGDRVLDVACGTGLSLDLLHAAVGERGEIVGVEVSPEMLQLARARVTSAGWSNVTLIEAAVEDAALVPPFDAVLFHFTHDVLRSPDALQKIFAAARGQARVAFAGMKYAPRWMAPANVLVRAKARPYMTTLDGLATPWDLALAHLRHFEMESVMLGTGYIGWGRAA